jgi:hypothetical protein
LPELRGVPRRAHGFRRYEELLVKYCYLNCGTVQAIPADGSVTYQMKLPLPSGLPAGFSSKLDWQIQGGTGAAAATSLTVEPRT